MKRYNPNKFLKLKEEDSLSDLTDVDLVDKLVEFIRANPFPKDDALHKFAEENKIDADMMEQYVYAMLTLILCGGKSKGKEIKASDENINIGKKIEIEHVEYDSDNKVIKKMQDVLIQKIYSDHLFEDSEYYISGVDFKTELKAEGKMKESEDEEEHYSDIIIKDFINNGWKKDKEGISKIITLKSKSGGDVNPSGKIKIYGKFEKPSKRYFVLNIRWDEADWDGREYIGKGKELLKDVEKEVALYDKGKSKRFVNTQK